MRTAIAHQLHCAFCRRSQSDVPSLAIAPHKLAGLPIAICARCALNAALDMWGPGNHLADPAAQPSEDA